MKKAICQRYIEVIKDIYDGAWTSIKSSCKVTKEFFIIVDLHLRLTFSPFLFV